MKKFIAPEIEVTSFSVEDVITVSADENFGGAGNED